MGEPPKDPPVREQSLEEILGNYRIFVQDSLRKARESGIDLKGYPIDHLCYRVETLEDYERMKQQLMRLSKGFLENAHHGRPISKFLLREPLQVDGYSIPVIELPAPRLGQNTKTVLEHLEMVVGEDYPSLKNKHESLWSGIDDSGEFNQPVYITFENGNSVKFHRLPITEVVRLEGNIFAEII